MDYKFKTKPYKHQMTALEKSWNKQNFAYFMEMGTGKTKVLIDNMSMLYDKGKVDGALIIAPKGVIKTWYEQELPAHLPNHIENVTVLWQANITKGQQEKLESLFEIETALHILIMNVEALSTDKGVKFAAKFLNSHKVIMAIDESTTIKTPTAKRTKNIIGLGKYAKYKRIMTGSPVTKNPLDLYSQCEFLDPYLLDFTSYYAFRNRYAEMKTMHLRGRSIQVVDEFKNLGELSDTVKTFSPSSGMVRDTLSPTLSSSRSAVGRRIPIVSFFKKSSRLPSISSVFTRSNTVSSTAPSIRGLWL